MGKTKTNWTALIHRLTEQAGADSDYTLGVHHEDDEVDDAFTLTPSDVTAIGAQTFAAYRTAAFDTAFGSAWSGYSTTSAAERDELFTLFRRARIRLSGGTP